MDVQQINERVAAIARQDGDDESQHAAEDALWEETFSRQSLTGRRTLRNSPQRP
ncbi:hypothetical protein [Streptomyces olivaceiscleroticus]|uniref:Uncharacterized protein n=1 Tax=Streptomyces olivaceiscleroticus TaxID=68245 RepID=A0ABP3LGZ3_9ACTN